MVNPAWPVEHSIHKSVRLHGSHMRRRGAAAQTRRVRELELEKVMDQGSPPRNYLCIV